MRLLLGVIVLLLFACKQVTIEVKKENKPTDTVVLSEYYQGLEKYFPLTKPVDKGDSIISFHNPSNSLIKIYLPLVDGQYAKQVNVLAKKVANKEAKDFIKTVYEYVEQINLDNGDTSLFEAWPVKAYCTDSSIGIAYLNRLLPWGAVHSGYHYKTVNILKGKELADKDVFSLPTHDDTLAFTDILTKQLIKLGCTSCFTNVLNDELNFLIRNDSIDFFFSNYAVGAFSDGAPSITLAKSEIKRFIKK